MPGPLLRPKTGGARIRKDGPPTAREEEALGPHDDAGTAFRGGGRFQGSLGDVCLRWSEPESREREEGFVVSYDGSGIDALLSRLLEEPTVLVILEATGGFERTVVGALAAAGLPVVLINPRQVRDFARATGRGSPRSIGSMPRSWRASPKLYGPLLSPFPIERSALCKP